MECHKCEHQAAVASGMFKGVPFEETPCGKCKGHPRSSMATLAYDDNHMSLEDAEALGACVSPEGNTQEPERKMPVSVLLDVVKGLLSITAQQRDVICMRQAGVSYKEIAKSQGVSIAAVEHSHRRAMVKWPALQAMFAVKSLKQSRRRRPGSTPRRVEAEVHRSWAGWRRCGNGYVRIDQLDSETGGGMED